MKKSIIFIFMLIFCFTNIVCASHMEDGVKALESYDLDEWGILALYSAGIDVSFKNLEKIHSNTTTDYEAYILGAVPLGRDVSEEIEKVVNSQNDEGKFADNIDGTGNELVNSHIWGIISLYVAGEDNYDKEKALEWLKENQNSDGGFPIFIDSYNSDLDMTAMGIVAYKALGLDSNSYKVKKALNFIKENLDKKESCESLSWYIMTKKILGLNIENSVYKKFLEYKVDDGGFKHLKRLSRSNYMATWHAVLAMSDYHNDISVFTKLHNLNAFKDLNKNDYAYDQIIELINKDIISGYPDNTFKPNNNVKRAEFTKMLVYALGYEELINEKTYEFDDLTNHWANETVKVAVNKGLIKGVGNGKFAPEENITGAEVIAMIVRAEGLEQKAKSIEGNNWYDGYLEIGRERNLLYKNFNLKENATRAQCAEVVSRLIN